MSGLRIEVVGYHSKTLQKPKPGEHLWTFVAMFRVTPGEGRFELDHENLLTIEGPGCFVCEQDWTPEIAARPCPGEPGGQNSIRWQGKAGDQSPRRS